jgi:hypothetical protein
MPAFVTHRGRNVPFPLNLLMSQGTRRELDGVLGYSLEFQPTSVSMVTRSSSSRIPPGCADRPVRARRTYSAYRTLAPREPRG